MDVKASHRLGDNSSLRRQAPVPGTKAVEQRGRRCFLPLISQGFEGRLKDNP
jgi:hypothetical protein